ncbi:hypothetical protein AAFF_G00267630 [Aldrovandia affinis]|uniref:Uncharacterized protein n=1 Tax=Aldrovandia affinis TaxID=143900 RepID=A0AAD7SRX6_9TELE|nr:hypothetical protein AAFF_G00267630 [Aldrovandia affinis]
MVFSGSSVPAGRAEPLAHAGGNCQTSAKNGQHSAGEYLVLFLRTWVKSSEIGKGKVEGHRAVGDCGRPGVTSEQHCGDERQRASGGEDSFILTSSAVPSVHP